MRAAFVIVLLVACGGGSDAALDNGGGYGGGSDTDGGEGGAAGECAVDSDCVLAGATCCACPTFAMPVDPANDICAGVECPAPGSACAQNIHAACAQGACVLACNVLECDQQCADGFAIDASGCETCACLDVTSRSCSSGSDCSEVPADCCGCTLGGSDTAVPTSDVASYEASLGCSPDPSCPGVNTCQADVSPQCVQGACALVAPLPANACGRPDLPACPSGMYCALNSDAGATAQGVGTCLPSP
jgi:hypothetical protein